MALSLPSSFKNDIQGKDTALYPVIQISDLPLISTNVNVGTDSALPILLNIPHLKESIDIKTRKYKISNVSILLSNYEYEGLRLSERITDSLINKECDIYWLSPSTTMDDAFKVYHGVIRRYDIGVEKIKLTVEDLSQSKLHKDLPIPENWLGAEDIPDKYKNKSKPMVYGRVDKSPCVISYAPVYEKGISIGKATMSLDSDNRTTLDDDDSLQIYKDDLYTVVPRVPEYGFGSEYTSQYEAGADAPNEILIGHEISTEYIPDEDVVPYNHIIVYRDLLPGKILPLRELAWANDESEYFSDQYGWTTIPATNTEILYSNSVLAHCSGTLFKEGYITDFSGSGVDRTENWPRNRIEEGCFQYGNYPPWGDYIPSDNITEQLENEADVSGYGEIYSTSVVGISIDMDSLITDIFESKDGDVKEMGLLSFKYEIYAYHNSEFTTPTNLQNLVGLVYGGYSTKNVWLSDQGSFSYQYQAQPYYIYQATEDSQFGDGLDWDENNPDESIPFHVTNSVNTGNPNEYGEILESEPALIDTSLNKLVFYMRAFNRGIYGAELKIRDLKFRQYAILENMTSFDMFANVTGRLETPTVPDIIRDIITTELDEEIEFADTDTTPYGWKYAFCQDKKISSKKLFEGLASASPYIPRLNSEGKFKFDYIPANGGELSDLEGNEKILESDVIDYSFSRTKPEQVYTKVILKWNWDYGRDDFSETPIERSVNDLTNLPNIDEDGNQTGYDFDYYGLNSDHSDSTLTIDDDRGKYIRTEETAIAFAEWLLLWHCNQHLVIKAKLPLKYLNLEVGDMVRFGEQGPFDEIEPYSIDYTKSQSPSALSGGQGTFDKFLITSTNKTLEYVQIEAVQMHNLEDDYNIYGCMDSEACNYNEFATLDPNGECIYRVDEYHNCPPPYGIGGCISDSDGDGICDGQDDYPDCPGINAYYDECGMCNGLGPLYTACDGTLQCTQELANAVICGCSEQLDQTETAHINYNHEANSNADIDPNHCIGCSDQPDIGGYMQGGICPYKENTNGVPTTNADNAGYIANPDGTCNDCPNDVFVLTWANHLDECMNAAMYWWSFFQSSGGQYPTDEQLTIYNEVWCDWEEYVKHEIIKIDVYFQAINDFNDGSDPNAWIQLGTYSPDSSVVEVNISQYPTLKDLVDYGHSAAQNYYNHRPSPRFKFVIRFDYDPDNPPTSYDNNIFTMNIWGNSGTSPSVPGTVTQFQNTVEITNMTEGQEDETAELYFVQSIFPELGYSELMIDFWPIEREQELFGFHGTQIQQFLFPLGVDLPVPFEPDIPAWDGDHFDVIFPMELLGMENQTSQEISQSFEDYQTGAAPVLTLRFTYQQSESLIGDLNSDGIFDVLDMVAISGCVLMQSCNDYNIDDVLIADANGDGIFDVLDIMTLANCVMAQDCGNCFGDGTGIQPCE